MQRRAPELPRATILKRVDYTSDLFSIKLDKKPDFIFKSGQYITIGVDGLERPYSIVSAPEEPFVELFIERIPPEEGGQLTPVLHTLKEGQTVSMRPRPKGLFLMEPKFTAQVMVCTVTGIAPFMSMLRDHFAHKRSGNHFYILHGGSYHDELVYSDELTKMAAEHPKDMTYVPTVSRPKDPRNTSWTGEGGRVNLIVDKYLDKFALDPKSTIIYVCGHPGMIEDVKQRFGPKGWYVKEERYWKEE
jgi:ferredoxin--NADP+ reductase